jgi:hypothetical protein
LTILENLLDMMVRRGDVRYQIEGRFAVNTEKRDRVLVNVAPFIGSMSRCRGSVPCEILERRGNRVYVRTEPPYRELTLWILSDWIQGEPAGEEQSLVSLGQG